MTTTTNLGLPLIDGAQAQKHVTHNEALDILDAVIQIAVRDRNRTAPPDNPAEGARHIVAAGASGAWGGQVDSIAHFSAGGWDFRAPHPGWCAWSIADRAMLVFDGTAWFDVRTLALDNLTRLGINTAAGAPNLLSVRSNAALIAAIAAADGGSGDVRLQLSKESAVGTASVVFSDNYSGRAEFGLVGSDAFKLKVSADGAGWAEALSIDPASGQLTLPRGLSLAGAVAPPTLVADQNDYAPAGLPAAAVLKLSADAPHSLTGLAGGIEGRIVVLINSGGSPITLRDAHAASGAANRFALGSDLVLAGKQATVLRYDGTAQRWFAIAGGRGSAVALGAPQGRLTLQSGVPVMTTSQAAKTVLYYTPYAGHHLPLYDGSGWIAAAFAELTAATTDTGKSPAAIGAGKVNDWFVWNDAGTLRLSHGPDWSNDTTRGAAGALVRVEGIWLNAADVANGPAALRGTYVGTTRSNSLAQLDYILGGAATGGVAGFLGVWNAYNRVNASAATIDSGPLYTYSDFAIRQARSSKGNQISYVAGLDEDAVEVAYQSFSGAVGVVNAYASVGIGLDSVAAFNTGFVGGPNAIGSNANYYFGPLSGILRPGVGVHVVSANEQSDGLNANQFCRSSNNFLTLLCRT